jgi:DNA polymerase III epsilon subunit-like protein
MNLFLDTETTGTPDKYMNWKEHYEKYPYIVSIAWKVSGKPPKYFIIHQEGRKIPAAATAIHGITSKVANDPNKTQPASYVYREILLDANDAMNIIGHNLYFDVSMVKANILRLFGPDSQEAKASDEVFHKDKRIDTMRSSQKYFKKWPKLIELHEYLFKKDFEAHSALEDMLACERCFNELMKKKMI